MYKFSTIGMRLKKARLLKGLTQGKLGSEAGSDPIGASVKISRYESGTHTPAFEMAQRLAAVLSVPVAYLYCDDDDLAELIHLYYQLKKADQRKMLATIKKLGLK